MQNQYLKKKKLPDAPGVYIWKKGQNILYIGKATSLKDRVQSYFAKDLINTRGPLLVDMVFNADRIDFIQTDSVLEALILESELIKKHQPKYNTKERDDKSYNYVVITDENFPRVLLVRQREIKSGAFTTKTKEKFGPFPNAGQLREALRLIQKIFPFFDTNVPIEKITGASLKRINLNIEIGIYPNVFTNPKTAKKEYSKTIKNIILFFKGKKSKVIKNLEKQMRDLAKNQQFEHANQIKKTIFALQHINDVALISEEKSSTDRQSNFRIESYDIAHTSGAETVGVMVVSENGELKKSEYKKFIIKSAQKNDDYGALLEVLQRRFNHPEWQMPNLIIIDGGIGQKNVAENFLADLIKNSTNESVTELKKIQIVSVVKDDKHQARDILGDSEIIAKWRQQIIKINAETHRFAIAFHRKRRGVLK